jgi:DNA-binding transcriptional LysR family regulator
VIRELECFVLLAEELHFSHAARRVHLSQPAFSQAIRRLERELGVQLFERAGGVQLTASGRLLLPEAIAVLERHGNLLVRAERLAANGPESLTLGYAPGLGPLAASTARWIRHLRPAISVDITAGPPTRLAQRLDTGSLDAVLAPGHTRHDSSPLLTLPIDRAVTASDHPLASRAELTVRELAGQTVLLPTFDSDPAYHSALAALLATVRASVPIVTRAFDSFDQAMDQVAASRHVMLLPEAYFVTQCRDDVVPIRFRDAHTQITVHLACTAGMGTALAAIVTRASTMAATSFSGVATRAGRSTPRTVRRAG